MKADLVPTAAQSIILSAAFAVCCVGINRLFWGLIHPPGLEMPPEPFLPTQSFGVLIGLCGFLLILIARGQVHKTCVRGVLTIVAAVLLLVVLTFIGTLPRQHGFDSVILVGVDCWLALVLSVPAEVLFGKGATEGSV